MDQNILVVCTGNSARSQMAEAFIRKHHGDRFKVYSAGTQPSDRVFPPVVQVMQEIDLDISGNTPKSIKEFLGHKHFKYVIIVCSGADKECPAIFGAAERVVWPFNDPAAIEGTEQEILEGTRQIRNKIEEKIKEWTPRLV